MKNFHQLAVCMGIATALATALAPVAHAEPVAIGLAASVEHHVVGIVGGKSGDLPAGGDVFANETVRTEANAMARLTFKDNTNLAVGPSSSVVLDKFVFNAEETAANAVLNTALGGFRFATGHSDPRAFKINTPVATIGIRGTVLDIENTPGQSLIVLKKGGLHVCLRNVPTKCTDLTQPNDYVLVRKTTISGAQPGGANEFDFHRYCVENGFTNWGACNLGGDFSQSIPTGGRSSDPPPPPPRNCRSTANGSSC